MASRSRLRRALWITLVILALGVVGVVGSAWWLLGHLDSPIIQTRASAWLKGITGLDVEYRDVKIVLGERVSIGRLRLAQPASLAGYAADAAVIEGVDVQYSLSDGVSIERATINRVVLTIIKDDARGTTIDAIVAGLPKRDAPKTPTKESPLSLSLASLVGAPLFSHAEIKRVDVEWIVGGDGKVRDRGKAEWIALDARAASGPKYDVTLRAIRQEAGDADDDKSVGVGVRITRAKVGEPQTVDLLTPFVRAWIDPPRAAKLHAYVDLGETQSLRDLPMGRALTLDAHATFKPEAHEVEVKLDGLTIMPMNGADEHAHASTAKATVTLPDDSAQPIALDDAMLCAHLDRLQPWLARTGLGAEGAELSVEVSHATFGGPDAIAIASGKLKANAAKLAWSGMSAASLHLLLDLDDVHPGIADPLTSRGKLELSGAIGAFSLVAGRARIDAGAIKLWAASKLDGAAPYAASAQTQLGTLTIKNDARALLVERDAVLKVAISKVRPQPKRWLETEATIDVELGLTSLMLFSHTVKRSTDADYDVTLDADSLALLEPFISSPTLRVPWPSIAASLHSKGTIRNVASPTRVTLAQKTELSLTKPSAQTKDDAYSAGLVEIVAASSGTLTRGDADVSLVARALKWNERVLGDVSSTSKARFDLSRPRVELAWKMKGAQGPDVALDGFVDWNGKEHRLAHQIKAEVARVGALEGLIRPMLAKGASLDLSTLGVSIESAGSAVLDPARMVQTARGTQKTKVLVEGIDFHRNDKQGLRAKRIALDVDANIQALYPRSSGSVALAIALDGASQTFIPGLPIDGLRATARLEGDARGAVRLKEAKLESEASKTLVELSGGFDLSTDALPGRRALWLRGTLQQTLDGIADAIAPVRAQGKIRVPFLLESGDLKNFHAATSIELDHVGVTLPSLELVLDDARGQLPVDVEFRWTQELGLALVGTSVRQGYPRVRYRDHQPFLRGENYFSIEGLRLKQWFIGPLAGNLRLDRNVFTIDQLEGQLRGARVTGLCRVDYRGRDTEIEFRGAISGLMPDKVTDERQRLDANVALTVSPYNHDIEGRVDLVRVGKRHLLDLLALYDPSEADVAANRARLALKVGYPKSVRLGFSDGFASARLDLGGIASIIRIDEIRGIPSGPLVARYLGDFIPKAQEEKQP